MVEVYTKKEVDDLQQKLWEVIHTLRQQVDLLEAGQSDWVPLEEAMRLTGRSRSWFYEQRGLYKLPIAMLPRTEGSRRTMYSRADCVAYGRRNSISPSS